MSGSQPHLTDAPTTRTLLGAQVEAPPRSSEADHGQWTQVGLASDTLPMSATEMQISFRELRAASRCGSFWQVPFLKLFEHSSGGGRAAV